MPSSQLAWLVLPCMWEAVTLWPDFLLLLRAEEKRSLSALKKLSPTPWHMLEILRLPSWQRFCLSEALQQITQDLARQRERENASLIWRPTVRKRGLIHYCSNHSSRLWKQPPWAAEWDRQQRREVTHTLKHADAWTFTTVLREHIVFLRKKVHFHLFKEQYSSQRKFFLSWGKLDLVKQTFSA